MKYGDFAAGIEHYKKGLGLSSIRGTFSSEFIRGFTLEERQSKCGYLNRYWNKSTNYTRL